MGAKEEDRKLDVGRLHSAVWDFIDLSERRERIQLFSRSHTKISVFDNLLHVSVVCVSNVSLASKQRCGISALKND